MNITTLLSFATLALSVVALCLAFRAWRTGKRALAREAHIAGREAKIARLSAELVYTESLIRRLLAKRESDGCADYGAHERSEHRHVH